MNNGYVKIHIKELLKNKGLSQTKFLKLADMQQPNYKKWANSEIAYFDMNTICKICEVLGCTVGELLEYIPPQSKNKDQ